MSIQILFVYDLLPAQYINNNSYLNDSYLSFFSFLLTMIHCQTLMISHLNYRNSILSNLAVHSISSFQSIYKLPPGFFSKTTLRSHCSKIFNSSLYIYAQACMPILCIAKSKRLNMFRNFYHALLYSSQKKTKPEYKTAIKVLLSVLVQQEIKLRKYSQYCF